MDKILPAMNIPTRSSSIRSTHHHSNPSSPHNLPISPTASAKSLNAQPKSPKYAHTSLSTNSSSNSPSLNSTEEGEIGPNAALSNRRPISEFSTIAHHLKGTRTSLLQPNNNLADTHIQNGIQLHEQLNLTESTKEFERAANLGSSTGMYLFGMALRSGWGVQRDEKRSFEYLSRAADLALKYTSTSSTATRDASARELTLAIYELGQSLRNGWGVKKDRRIGVHYLQIAANLGDPDAQVDVATAFLNGDGVKRDKLAAVKYFRMAANNGYKAPNMTWIWKEKYNVTGILQTCKAAF